MTIQLKWYSPKRNQEYTNTFYSVKKAQERVDFLNENKISFRLVRDDSESINILNKD